MKKFLAFFITLVIALTTTICVYAADFMPLKNNDAETKVNFAISSSGQATVIVRCMLCQLNLQVQLLKQRFKRKSA